METLQLWSQEEWAAYLTAESMEWDNRWKKDLIMQRGLNFVEKCGKWREQLRKVWGTVGGKEGWGPTSEYMEEIYKKRSRFSLGFDEDEIGEDENEHRQIEDEEADEDDEDFGIEEESLAEQYD